MKNALDKQSTMKDNLTDRQTEYLSLETTRYLKGFFAVLVLITHIYGMLFIRMPENIFLHSGIVRVGFFSLGYLSVGMFFFFSGYGLMYSYCKKEKDYIKQFPKQRLFPFYVKYSILILLYTLFYIVVRVEGKEVTLVGILKSFTLGGTLVSKGWYLQAIIWLYIIFYIGFHFFNSDKAKVIAVTNGLFFYCMVCLVMDWSQTWYECIFTFLLGMIWYKKQEKISRKVEMHYMPVLIISFVIFCVFYIWGNTSIFVKPLKILSKMISAVGFTALIMIVIKKSPLPFYNIISKVGMISFELYVIHGLFLDLFHYGICVKNNTLYVITVVICAFTAACILHPLFGCVDKKVKEILK